MQTVQEVQAMGLMGGLGGVGSAEAAPQGAFTTHTLLGHAPISVGLESPCGC